MIVGALELGGSHVSAARVDLESAAVHGAVRLPLDAAGSRADLLAAILDAARSVEDGVTCVGVAVPGPFDYANGVCIIDGVGKLEALFGVDLRLELSHVFVEAVDAITFLNDAEAFLLGEACAGTTQGHARVIGITLGTGLGSAFLADGEIVRDEPGVPPEGNLHLASFRGGPVEDSISGRAICARFDGVTGVDEIAAHADQGDPLARAVLSQVGEDLGEFLAPWCSGFGASLVVVGGSIARAWRHFEPGLSHTSAVAVAATRLDDAPLLGAAFHAVAQRPRIVGDLRAP